MSAPLNNQANENQQGVTVEVRGLHKSFGRQEVLKGVDFKVNAGEIFVIMGPSGSGKTVLLKHIIGLEPPDAGEILINGESIQSPDVMNKYRLALVFQSGDFMGGQGIGQSKRHEINCAFLLQMGQLPTKMQPGNQRTRRCRIRRWLLVAGHDAKLLTCVGQASGM